MGLRARRLVQQNPQLRADDLAVADVAGSGQLIYCLDEHEQVDRVVPRRDRQVLVKENVRRYHAQYDSAIRHAYREPRDVVLTSLLTGRPDAARPPDLGMLHS
jgi:hypothetical protein